MARIGDVMALRVVTVRPDESVRVAIARMLEEGVGSVAICDGDRLAGIFTERDVLRLAGQEGGLAADARVEDVMTRSVITVSPDDDVLAVAELMRARRIRHVPVVEDGNLLGIVGIRDVLRSVVEVLWREHDPHAREAARGLLRRG